MAQQLEIVARALRMWLAEGREAVLATVVSSTDSAPRGLGAQIAIRDDLTWVGGLSGGCAEADVVHRARALLADESADGRTAALLFPMTKDSLGTVGPMCGATLEVLAERVDHELADHMSSVAAGVRDGRTVQTRRVYTAGDAGRDERPLMRAELICEVDHTSDPTEGRLVTCIGSDARVVVEDHVPASLQLVIGGGGDVSIELIALAKQLGWRTAVVDPRGGWLSQTTRAAEPDHSVQKWPQEALDELDVDSLTACVSLAHDEKLDLPFLTTALASPAFYVGSVGSRKVQRERAEQLAETVGEDVAGRHRGPAGLDLGGSGAAEMALSIVAEILATWNGREGRPLVHSREPIRAR